MTPLASAGFSVLSGVCAWYCFKTGRNWGGWFNLFASAFNTAIVLVHLSRSVA